jgi:hypothetical protein
MRRSSRSSPASGGRWWGCSWWATANWLSGEIELASDGRRVRARAHPGDVAALAWRLNLAVLVPADVASAPFEEDWTWWCEAPSEAVPGPDEVVTFQRLLREPDPED